MTTPSDPFSESFDSIELDGAASREAIEHALAFCGPPQEQFDQPGFYLIDDAGGRFIVDRDIGVISLADEAILAREHGSIHAIALRVVQAAGDSYRLDLNLRLTGLVPQMVGQEIDFFADAPSLEAIDESARAQDDEDSDDDFGFLDEIEDESAPWAMYAAAVGVTARVPLGDEAAPYGTLLSLQMPPVHAGFAGLTLIDVIPAPAPRGVIWSL